MKFLPIAFSATFSCCLAFNTPFLHAQTTQQEPVTQGFQDGGQQTESPADQDSASQSSTQESESQKAPFEERFWRYLSANNYKNWAPVPGQSGDFARGESPHGELVKMYLNRTAAGNIAEVPNGSVIIKENYGEDQTLKSITAMYRTKGFNPDAGDWYWVKYRTDGTVARTGADPSGEKVAGRFQGCINCHQNAGGGDFTFFND